MARFSEVGKKKVAAHLTLYVINILVLALSARVNMFQEFFFVADMFPFALSVVSLAILTIMLTLDFAISNSYTGRPQFEIGIFAVLAMFWLGFNAFSTSRWRHVPMSCSSIPSGFSDVKTWCQDLQALKAFVWIEWMFFFFTALITLRYTITQKARGNQHITQMPLSRYSPSIRSGMQGVSYGRDSEFLQYGKI